MTEAKRPLKVFLCHAHSDKDAVKALYTRLTNDGVDAWLDKEKLLPGQDWEMEIHKAVREADVIIVCLSKQFNQRGYRQKEVRLALDEADMIPEGEIFIIPARLEECESFDSLQKWHWVDLFNEEGYKKLLFSLIKRASSIGAHVGHNAKTQQETVNRFIFSHSIPFIISFNTPLLINWGDEFELTNGDTWYIAGLLVERELRKNLHHLIDEKTYGLLEEKLRLTVFDAICEDDVEPVPVARASIDTRTSVGRGKLYTEYYVPSGVTFRGVIFIEHSLTDDLRKSILEKILVALLSIEHIGGRSSSGHGLCAFSLERSISEILL